MFRADTNQGWGESVRYCQQHKGLEVYAYCLMSSHIHMIIGQGIGKKLKDIVRDLKKYTSTKIIESIQNNPKESRRELLIWLFEQAGKANSNNKHYQSRSFRDGNKIIIRSN